MLAGKLAKIISSSITLESLSFPNKISLDLAYFYRKLKISLTSPGRLNKCKNEFILLQSSCI